MTLYIQRRSGSDLETIDECDTWREARYLVQEYRIADPGPTFYISTRACKAWKEREKE